jgi:NADPH:quinone reductase-like Zn-dependent oxidoreductase
MASQTMKAAVMHAIGGPEVLKIQQWPKPKPQIGQVLIRIKAVGLNRSEMYTRQYVISASRAILF